MKIAVASKNPVKIRAALVGFQKMFPNEPFDAEGISVSSGVRHQPMNDAETLSGAWNRVEETCRVCKEADFWIGIEGGVEEKEYGTEAFGWVVVKDRSGTHGIARTGVFLLPAQIAALIQQGKELGEADDVVFGRTNSKQQNGAVGILTGNAIDRTAYYLHAIVLALIPLKNRELYTR